MVCEAAFSARLVEKSAVLAEISTSTADFSASTADLAVLGLRAVECFDSVGEFDELLHGKLLRAACQQGKSQKLCVLMRAATFGIQRSQ